MNKVSTICFVITLMTNIPKSNAQVYGNPNGTATAVTSNYKKVEVPAELKDFYQKIDDINDQVVKRPETFGPHPAPFEVTPQGQKRGSAENCSNRLLISYAMYKDANNKNPFYYDYMNAYNKGDYVEFLKKLNLAFVGHFSDNDTKYMDSRNLDYGKNGIVGEYYKLATQDFYDQCSLIWGGKDRLKGKAAGRYVDDLSGKMSKKDGYSSALNLAIIYSFGCNVDWGEGTFGAIDIDYQQSLAYLSQMETQKYFNTLSAGNTFLYKALKAYDLLQLGDAQKDITKLKQASDLYIDLWKMASDQSKWDAIFNDLVILAGYTHTASYCDYIEKINGTNDAYRGTHFDPYFLISMKLDLSFQLEKCCADIQALDANAVLSNNRTPAAYASQVFKQFITDWKSGSSSQNENKW